MIRKMPGKHKIAENYHKHQTLDKLSGVPATSMLKHLFTITSSHCSVNKHKIYDKTRKKYSICLAELHNSSFLILRIIHKSLKKTFNYKQKRHNQAHSCW